jgi:DNA-binding NtrC family response regulator
VLADFELGDGTALDLLAHLKALDNNIPVVVLTGHATIDLAVEAIKEGAKQFLTKPADMEAIGTVLQNAVESNRNQKKLQVRSLQSARYERDPFLGASKVIQELKRAVHRILRTDRPILIQGETGTGKTVLARWLHQHGSRSDEAFVDLNCAGLSHELLESELFGHEKGAFTGAVNSKVGLLEAADRGIVFLDEIGDMDLLIQPKLLKVLEEKRFHRLGEVRDRMVDVNVIAATHQDLAQLVQTGRFRSDLYFRINTVRLRIPSLRERVEDIRSIASRFLIQLSTDIGRRPMTLSEEALKALETYSWPGNIRELRNVLERAALLAEGDIVQETALDFERLPKEPESVPQISTDLTMAEVERQHILAVLKAEKGNVDRAAVRLDMPRSTLYSKIKHFGVAKEG